MGRRVEGRTTHDPIGERDGDGRREDDGIVYRVHRGDRLGHYGCVDEGPPPGGEQDPCRIDENLPLIGEGAESGQGNETDSATVGRHGLFVSGCGCCVVTQIQLSNGMLDARNTANSKG